MKSQLKIIAITLLTLYNHISQSSVTDNKVTVLHSGYVQPIKDRSFIPGAQDDGARKVASTISLVQGKDMVLISDPGMADNTASTARKRLETRRRYTCIYQSSSSGSCYSTWPFSQCDSCGFLGNL
ncbi:MAG: hypothetical protein JKY19_13070 [Alcanivoracaceae bacterium]|nr:hypothetical protein [Alcanivoracaceae bacterium]